MKKLKNVLIAVGIMTNLSFFNCFAADLLESQNVKHIQGLGYIFNFGNLNNVFESHVQKSGNMFNYEYMIRVLNGQNEEQNHNEDDSVSNEFLLLIIIIIFYNNRINNFSFS